MSLSLPNPLHLGGSSWKVFPCEHILAWADIWIRKEKVEINNKFHACGSSNRPLSQSLCLPGDFERKFHFSPSLQFGEKEDELLISARVSVDRLIRCRNSCPRLSVLWKSVQPLLGPSIKSGGSSCRALKLVSRWLCCQAHLGSMHE